MDERDRTATNKGDGAVDDLKQYMTSLLYYAHNEAVEMSRDEYDKWVEDHIELIDEYFEKM